MPRGRGEIDLPQDEKKDRRRHERPDDLYSVVLVTCPASASRKISQAILDEHAAACVNIVRDVESLFLWKGKVEKAKECLLLVKTKTSRLDELERVVRGVHPYEVPEIIAVPIARGYGPYLGWIAESVDELRK
jgi:periplasmic divalent cation tolerance protein